jgi:hypothetical protein
MRPRKQLPRNVYLVYLLYFWGLSVVLSTEIDELFAHIATREKCIKKKTAALDDEMLAQSADLWAAHNVCNNQEFGEHLKAAGISQSRAWRYMALTSEFVTNGPAAPISVSARYYLLNVGTPADREEALALANNGKTVDEERAHQLVKNNRAKLSAKHTCGGTVQGVWSCTACQGYKVKDSLSQFKYYPKKHTGWQAPENTIKCPTCYGLGYVYNNKPPENGED